MSATMNKGAVSKDSSQVVKESDSVDSLKISSNGLVDFPPAIITAPGGTVYKRAPDSKVGEAYRTEAHKYEKFRAMNDEASMGFVIIKLDRLQKREINTRLPTEIHCLDLLKERLDDRAYEYIVRYDGQISVDGYPALVLEYLEGGDGLHYLKTGPKDSGLEEKAAVIMRDILVALTIVHSAGIIHRDTKPENFVRKSKGGRWKLIDFGLSSELSTEAPTSRGAYEYRSPEGGISNEITEKADLWSLGVCLYELLSGQKPFEILPDETRENTKIFDRMRETKPDYTLPEFENYSNEAMSFLKRLLTSDPEERPSARQALQDEWFKTLELDTIIDGDGDSWWLKKKQKGLTYTDGNPGKE